MSTDGWLACRTPEHAISTPFKYVFVPVNERLAYLLEQVRKGQATPEEYKALREMILEDESGSVTDRITAFHQPQLSAAASLPRYNPAHWQPVVAQVLQADKLPGIAPVRQLPGRRYTGRWWAAAAVMLLIVATSAYLWLRDKHEQVKTVAAVAPSTAAPIRPGKNGAILTLSDNSQLVLDSLGNGVVATQNGTQVVYTNGRLVYAATGKTASDRVAYNTITTPRGRQFSTTLPDGSRVWLNAVSSLKYPVAFTGGKREVELTGEGYFEVTADASAPFTVKNGSLQVAVLGTSFNMMCYGDEAATSTTLVSGTVKVSRNGQTALLHPGKQVIAGNGQWQVVQADVEEALAWKNGLFQLNSADIATVMRQIARWYDVEVAYVHGIPGKKLVGFLQREKELQEAIDILKASGIDCRLDKENRRLIVE